MSNVQSTRFAEADADGSQVIANRANAGAVRRLVDFDFVDEPHPRQDGKVAEAHSSETRPSCAGQELLHVLPTNTISRNVPPEAFNEYPVASPIRPLEAREVTSIFSTRKSAELVRYFIDRCACFFDFSDVDRHFAYVVPLLARRNATLANAMLALAARHRSRTSDFDPYTADRYYHACLQTLIPRLGETAAARDDELLAAVVVLRLLEEMDVPIFGSDPQKHLFGTQAIINASQAQSPSPVTPLRKACYWAAFRQEIFMSLSFQRPFKLRLPEAPPDSCDDWSWTLKATYQCGKVQQFVFGEECASLVGHRQLMGEVELWKTTRPTAFDPIYQDVGCGDSFPHVYLHMDCHVMGWQYITLAHLLLVAHQPLPRVGPLHRQTMMEVQYIVREDVRLLCGIARSNPQNPSAKLVACMAIALFGDRFEFRSEQYLLRDLLVDTEASTGWPTSMARAQLEGVWNWTHDDSQASHGAAPSTEP
ncbi:hypothetical protein PV04_08494 [Phialophora macrospora]|uniref:Transcription factor domain-containing protein n=1 Tax=Phialophora macrospora TaxID=1851006 RepID=A0A0D2DVZ9_9EURO|nr:hypothetical protein PV04_08494 [Phialophora macrospora]